MKNIIVGITGSIAAYKAAELVRGLKQQGADVQVVMTECATAFITPLTLQALSGKPVLVRWNAAETEFGMDHIQLARWADAILCAPASANFIAKLAQGFADDLLSTLCLATRAPIFVVPAMNPSMWSHPATQQHKQILEQRQVTFLGPVEGMHACGEEGLGRMMEPAGIIQHFLLPVTKSLESQRVLITAGPTHEAIDPVRYLSNRSSGKMGFALAEAARRLGAQVTLISGPVQLTSHTDIRRIDVISAQDMLAAVMQEIAETRIFISAAAVADYQPHTQAPQKLKKSSADFHIQWIKTPDILGSVGELPHTIYKVGFALETENLQEHAQKKLLEKNLDMVIANQPSANTGFGCDTNAATILYANGKSEDIPLMKKTLLAHELMLRIAQQF